MPIYLGDRTCYSAIHAALYDYPKEDDAMEILTWQARTDRHLTLKQLEALTGISKSTLNTIENGITSPTLRQLEAIAAALDVKITDLFDSEYK